MALTKVARELLASGRPGYRYIRTVYVEASGTYDAAGTVVPDAAADAVLVECYGSGGSGGGAALTAAGNASAGGGGGAGGAAFVFKDFADLVFPVTLTVGASAAAAAAGAAGNAGAETSFGAHCVAGGGSGGSAGTASATNAFNSGGAGGAGTAGDYLLRGTAGLPGLKLQPLAVGGAGGSSLQGNHAPLNVTTTTIAGSSANGFNYGYGAGGSGGANGVSQGAAVAGGPSRQGGIVIHEYAKD